MESLVSYCSDDEENDSCSGIMETNQNQKELGTISRHADEDTNYDNVQMDMSEESNNNNSPDRNSSEHSGDSCDSENSSGSSSRSRKSSSSEGDGSPERHRASKTSHSHNNRETLSKAKSPELHSAKKSPGVKELSSNSLTRSREYERKEHASENLKKDHSGKDRPHSERLKEKEHSRDSKVGSKDRKDGHRSPSRERRSHSHGKDQRSSPHGRDRDRHCVKDKGTASERKRAHSRSRSPAHTHASSRHSDSSSSRSSKDSHRTRSRSRDRRSSRTRSRSKERASGRRRSRSKDRQRSRSRERRRGPYEKKPNKLTILERLGIELRPPDSMPSVTPQQLLQRSMEQQVAQVKCSTGIELPKYYNPAAMNPMRYAEQMQKKKLLWGGKAGGPEGNAEPKPTQQSNNKWEGTTFAQDQDGKMSAKFKRLMGIKDTGQGTGGSNSTPVNSNELLKKQEELFNSMEMQYEVARVATHTHRGVGLGFGTFQYPR